MTEQERQEIKAKLIELGFWESRELGNPASDQYDATALNGRLDAKLADDVYLVSTIVDKYSLARQVQVFNGDRIYTLATADNYPEAICRAALALPEFLKQHPECAADQK